MRAARRSRAHLARRVEREAQVKAWQYLDADYVIEQARARDQDGRRGALHGVPFGIKDIFDAFDMPTEYGSPI